MKTAEMCKVAARYIRKHKAMNSKVWTMTREWVDSAQQYHDTFSPTLIISHYFQFLRAVVQDDMESDAADAWRKENEKRG